MSVNNLFDWIERELRPRRCTSVEFAYDDMDSQSDRQLPIIYQPFDSSKRSHWADRGACLDYWLTAGDGKLLDFGPGDGWPSLIVAPFVEHVTGVDGSARRVDVCNQNADRLGVSNAEFVLVKPGTPLPFPDNSFDGIMAASSIEQTPDPKAILRELCRVLRPGGHLRTFYEALSRYKGGRERDIWVAEIGEQKSMLTVYDRLIDREYVWQYGILFDLPERDLTELVSQRGGAVSLDGMSVPVLQGIKHAVVGARKCKLLHPSGPTLASWLREAGFGEIIPTESGQKAAVRLYDQTNEQRRPASLADIDDVLIPAVKDAVATTVPLDTDPMITAVK